MNVDNLNPGRHLKEFFEADEPDLNVPPAKLLEQLETCFASLDELLEELHCTPEDLQETLDSPLTSELITLKIKLAATQARLLAARYVPRTVHKLIQIADNTDKPEVARRAASALIQIAGVPITTASQPIEVPVSKQPEKKRPDKDIDHAFGFRCMSAVAQVHRLRETHKLDLNNIPDRLYPAFINSLATFFETNGIPRCTLNMAEENRQALEAAADARLAAARTARDAQSPPPPPSQSSPPAPAHPNSATQPPRSQRPQQQNPSNPAQ